LLPFGLCHSVFKENQDRFLKSCEEFFIVFYMVRSSNGSKVKMVSKFFLKSHEKRKYQTLVSNDNSGREGKNDLIASSTSVAFLI